MLIFCVLNSVACYWHFYFYVFCWMPLVFSFLHMYVNVICWSQLRDNDRLQKVAEPVGTEQREPEKQDVPEESPNESAESSKPQVCTVMQVPPLSCLLFILLCRRNLREIFMLLLILRILVHEITTWKSNLCFHFSAECRFFWHMAFYVVVVGLFEV